MSGRHPSPAEHQRGAVSRPLHLGPLILHDLHSVLVPGDLGRRFAFEGDLNGGCLTCLHSHRSGPQQVQHRGINFWRVWEIGLI